MPGADLEKVIPPYPTVENSLRDEKFAQEILKEIEQNKRLMNQQTRENRAWELVKKDVVENHAPEMIEKIIKHAYATVDVFERLTEADRNREKHG